MLLLAKLAARPSHGYELRRQVEETTGYALSNNSLYPTLRRFSEAGAVTKTAEPQEGKPPRHVYAITDVGRDLLRDMLADLPPDLAGEESEFLARLSHFDWLTAEERLRVLDARFAALTRRREHLSTLGKRAQPAQAGAWSGLVLDEVDRRIQAEQDWLVSLRAKASVPTAPEFEEENR